MEYSYEVETVRKRRATEMNNDFRNGVEVAGCCGGQERGKEAKTEGGELGGGSIRQEEAKVENT